jgi:hypothetical protein
MNNLSLINRYFNHGYVNKTGKAIAMISPEMSMKYTAKIIVDSYKDVRSETAQITQSEKISYSIAPFNNQIPELAELTKYIRTHLSPYLHSAFVHGSVATGEIIHYSDFDGLLVLKNDVLNNRKKVTEACKHINRTFAMMLRFDPIQHHGWMIVTENEFQNWPSEFFPPALFNFSRSLLDHDVEIHLYCHESREKLKENFIRYAKRLISNLETTNTPDNAYSLKSALSEFMLLPSLYVAARDGKGVFKKFSFQLAATDFTNDQWKVMDRVSEIRKQWPSMSFITGLQNLKKFSPSTKKQQLYRSKFPEGLLPEIDKSLFRDMSDFTTLMLKNLK